MQNQKQKVKSVKSTNTTQNKICKIRNKKLSQEKHKPFVGEQVKLSVKLAHGDRLGVDDVGQRVFKGFTRRRQLPLQGWLGLLQHLVTLPAQPIMVMKQLSSVQTSVSVTPTPTAWVHSSRF